MSEPSPHRPTTKEPAGPHDGPLRFAKIVQLACAGCREAAEQRSDNELERLAFKAEAVRRRRGLLVRWRRCKGAANDPGSIGRRDGGLRATGLVR